MPTKLKKGQKKPSNSKKPKRLPKEKPTIVEIYFSEILRVSLLILFFRIATAVVAGFIFRGYWRVILYKDVIPVIAFTEKIAEFRVINTFSIFFMNIVVFLIFFKIFIGRKDAKPVRLLAWYFGVVMSVATHILNIYFASQSERFGIIDTIDKPLIVYLVVTTLMYVTHLTFRKKEKDAKSKKAQQKNNQDPKVDLYN